MKTTTILPILLARHSGRTYDPLRSVSQEQLDQLIEAARWTPSCYGDEPWRFIICDRSSNKDAWNQAHTSLDPSNQTWTQDASVLIVVSHDTKFRRNRKFNMWGAYDTGAAAYGMMLEATAIGLMAHQMAGFDRDKVKALFAIPEDYEPISIMALGYEAENAPDKDQPRKRQDILAIFGQGNFPEQN